MGKVSNIRFTRLSGLDKAAQVTLKTEPGHKGTLSLAETFYSHWDLNSSTGMTRTSLQRKKIQSLAFP